jgi:hypothetical protein
MISDKATKCPNCGCPTKKDESQQETVLLQKTVPQVYPTYYEEPEEKSNKWLYVIIAVLLAIIAGGGYWWYSEYTEKNTIRSSIASDTKSATSSNESDSSSGNAMGTYYIEGSINGKYPIVMVLQREGNVLTGNYYYNAIMRKQGVVKSTYILLNGTIENDGTFCMRASFYESDFFEEWNGYIRNGNFYGTFYNEHGDYCTLKAVVNAGVSTKHDDNKYRQKGDTSKKSLRRNSARVGADWANRTRRSSGNRGHSPVAKKQGKHNLKEEQVDKAEEAKKKLGL